MFCAISFTGVSFACFFCYLHLLLKIFFCDNTFREVLESFCLLVILIIFGYSFYFADPMNIVYFPFIEIPEGTELLQPLGSFPFITFYGGILLINTFCCGEISTEILVVELVHLSRAILKLRKFFLANASLSVSLFFIDITLIHVSNGSLFTVTYFIAFSTTLFTFYNTYYTFLKQPLLVEKYIENELDEDEKIRYLYTYLIIGQTFPAIPFVMPLPWNIDILYQKALDLEKKRKKQLDFLRFLDI